MDIRELGRLDLNLLVALEALLEERSVSRAAERLFVTQSAMSKTLGRLRELFDDQLFIRKGAGMVPTPRAEQLGQALPQVLQAVQMMIQPEEFDPLSYNGEMNIMVQGHMGFWFLPNLLAELAKVAPGMRVEARTRAENPFEQLAAGELDFILQIERRDYPAELDLTTLAFASPNVLARKGHPLEGKALTMEDVVSYPQVSLVSTDISEMRFHEGEDAAVLEYQRQVQPQYQTDDLQTAVEIVRQTDCLFPAPPMFVDQLNLQKHIVVLPLPILGGISIKYVVVRHRRVLASPPHNFFYNLIVSVTETFRARFGLSSLEQLRRDRGLEY
jgi:DNA-binding transcriptional LysR family regulator